MGNCLNCRFVCDNDINEKEVLYVHLSSNFNITHINITYYENKCVVMLTKKSTMPIKEIFLLKHFVIFVFNNAMPLI